MAITAVAALRQQGQVGTPRIIGPALNLPGGNYRPSCPHLLAESPASIKYRVGGSLTLVTKFPPTASVKCRTASEYCGHL